MKKRKAEELVPSHSKDKVLRFVNSWPQIQREKGQPVLLSI